MTTKKSRVYWVWIKGKRVSTQEIVAAENRDAAIWKFAMHRCVKTIACDVVWIRKPDHADPETHDENGGTTGAPLPGYLR